MPMNRKQRISLSIFIAVFWCTIAFCGEIERRGIELRYDFQHISDGFGNVRTVTIKGYIKNTTDQDASVVNVQFKLIWQNRKSITQKLKFQNMTSGEMQEFQFEVDLADQPDVLDSIIPDISKIKFTTARKSSPVSVHNLIAQEIFSLSRISEEGKYFAKMLDDLQNTVAFTAPAKDEFETTDEYESILNFAENEHFSKLMDQLEKTVGEHLGGKGAIVRFLPMNVRKELAYLSESSYVFQIPIRLGLYNADRSCFEDVNLAPRTLSFPPRALVPDANIVFTHEDGFFFLKQPTIFVPRETAKIWRKNDSDLVIEITLRLGVVQDGPYAAGRCYVEEFKLKNAKTKEEYRKWNWTKAAKEPQKN
jgi:hypothetical protein